MSSRKYYCELCDKRFADNPQNRRNHMKGVQHQRMRKQHYDMFRDPALILAEEQSKKPCRTFQQTGDCRFAANCRFSHLTPHQLHDLEMKVQAKREMQKRKNEAEPDINDWLKKRNKKTVTTSVPEPVPETSAIEEEYMIPPSLLGIPNIPISLLPAPRGSVTNLPVLDWG